MILRKPMFWIVTCTLGAALFLALSRAEPRYQGKPVSFWLGCLPATTGCSNAEFSKRLPSGPRHWRWCCGCPPDDYRRIKAEQRAVKVAGR